MASTRLSSGNKTCEVCEHESVSHHCLDCEQDMCHKCMKMHLRFKTTSTHSFMDIVKTEIQKILAQTNELRNRVRDRIETNARNEDTIEKNINATKQEIKDFRLSVQRKCDALCKEVEEKGELILTELSSKRKELMERNESMGSQIDQLNRVLMSEQEDLSASLVMKKFADDNKIIDRSLRDSSTKSMDTIVFVNPLEGEAVSEMRVQIQTENDRGDSGAFVDPPFCERPSEDSKLQIVIPKTPTEEPPQIVPRIKQSPTRRNAPIPASPPESYVDMGYPTDATDLSKMLREISFDKYPKQILKHMQELTIQTDYSSTFQMINSEIWLVAGRMICVYSTDTHLIRNMRIASVISGKQASSINACVQNSRADVFVALTRDGMLSKRDYLSGLWMINPIEGHAVAKIAEGGYINVVADGPKIVGLREDKCKVTIHGPTGTGTKDWTEQRTVNIYGDNPSIMALNDSLYVTCGNHLNIYNPKGDMMKNVALPHKSDFSNWQLCCVDCNGQLILCDQTSGQVYLYDRRGKFCKIEFGEKGSALEEPTQVLPDLDGRLWVHEHTIYGTMVNCFSSAS